MMSKGVVLAVLLVVLAAAMEGRAVEGALSCGTVAGKLAPCAPYLIGKVGSPGSSCCGGVQSLYALTQSSRPDRISACGCLKSQSGALGGAANSANVANLPGSCGVNLGYTPSLPINCNGIP